MKYQKGKHIEYIKYLVKSGASLESICGAIVSQWGLDDSLDDPIADESTIESKIFDLAVYCEDPAYKDEQIENFHKILDLLEMSNEKNRFI